jgi:membrane protein
VDEKSFWDRMKETFSWAVFKETFKEWSNDKVPRLAAALAYYAATAMAPLVIGVIALAGYFFGTEQAQATLLTQVRTYMGDQGAAVVETIISNADQPDLARLAGLLSLVIFLWSASNIFSQLQDSLNTIWGVQLKPGLGIPATIRHRTLPVLMVLGAGLLLLASIVVTTALSVVSNLMADLLPGVPFLWQILNFLISVAVITLLFGVIFKVLPDVKIAWRDVWPGAALTALLFVIGQYVLSWYLGYQSGSSVYGAAGSLIVLLLWLYYATQIFLFGAEFTQVSTTRVGQGVRPEDDAVGRDQVATVKPAAQAANAGIGQNGSRSAQMETDGRTRTWQAPTPAMALAAPAVDGSPLGELVTGLLYDGRTLFRQEMQLAWAETRATLKQAARHAAMMAGGGLLLYTGVIILLIALPLLLVALTEMPLWLAVLLIGLLALVEGGIVLLWAQRKFTQLRPMPKQTIETVREDVEVVKEHLTT